MKRFSVVCAFVIGLSAVASADETTPAKNAYLIPPDRIWAYNMPGPRNVLALELDRKPEPGLSINDSPLVYGIFKSLSRPYQANETAGSAFVVQGVSKIALKNAHDVLTKQTERVTEFSSDTDLTLVFYSLTFGRYVWIDYVERSENEVIVNYRFVSHMTADSTTHFALIPLGRPAKGVVDVRIRQLPSRTESGTKLRPVSDPRRIVCESFSFHVVD